VWLVLAYCPLIGGPEKDRFYVVTATPLHISILVVLHVVHHCRYTEAKKYVNVIEEAGGGKAYQKVAYIPIYLDI